MVLSSATVACGRTDEERAFKVLDTPNTHVFGICLEMISPVGDLKPQCQ